MSTPKLTLIGAGPGDPDLITIKGVKALKKADVVLYDALVNPELLEYAPDAKCILVGKRAGQASVSQSTINRLIVEHALQGHHVVRLKGGDPFIFARGHEELTYAESFGIQTESIVGVSSIHLPGMYGIPLTVRGMNQSVTIVTATTSEGELSPDVRKAAAFSNSTIYFMGLRKLDQIVATYQELGKGSLPVALIGRGSLNDDMILQSTVDEIIHEIDSVEVPTPALLLFGEPAGINYSTMTTTKISSVA